MPWPLSSRGPWEHSCTERSGCCRRSVHPVRHDHCVLSSFDPEAPGWFNQPDYFDTLAALRAESPVHRYGERSWLITRWTDVREISRDPERFCSSRGTLANDPLRTGSNAIYGSILHMDPPAHGQWRGLVNRRFTPRAVTHLEARVRELARTTIGRCARGETIDAVEDLTAPFPVLVIAELLGIADGDRHDFRRWSDAAIESPDRPADRSMALMMELWQFLTELVRLKRREPGDDLTSVLVHAPIDGAPIATRDAVGYLLALLVAGNETTRHLLSGALLALWEHPEQQSALRRNADRIPDAVEELLRWVTPIQMLGRHATVDTTVGDTQVAAGDWVLMSYASANRDESVFGTSGSQLDVSRPTVPMHVGFGFGEHLCLGAALARLEARVFLEELFAAVSGYEIAGPGRWVESSLVRGMASLPLVLH